VVPPGYYHPVDVIGFGESSVDHVHVVAELPGGALSKVRILSSYTAYGGQVATAMAACAALGLRGRFLGPVGTDANAEGLLGELKARGVDAAHSIRRHAATRFAVILVHEASGDRFVLWSREHQLDVPPSELTTAAVVGARVVHVDATDALASIRLALLAREAGAVVTTDVDAVSEATVKLLAAATHPIVAEHVPHEMTGEADLATALRTMRQPHQRTVCVTLGERGAAALDGDDLILFPARSVHAVDTTGAGDVFRAGFIFGLVRHWPIRQILEFANAAAAVSCTRAGAMAGVPSLLEVEDLLARHVL
jgi:sulfofructose kinase